VFYDEYQNLESPSIVTEGLIWDFKTISLPIGISFEFGNVEFEQFLLSTEGAVYNVSRIDSNTHEATIIVPFASYYSDRGLAAGYDKVGEPGGFSDLSYKVDEIQGEQVLKFEWKNLGLIEQIESDGISTDFVNFQLWLFEKSNKIEFRYGPSSLTKSNFEEYFSSRDGFLCGLIDFDSGLENITKNSFLISGPPTNPRIEYGNEIIYDNNGFGAGTGLSDFPDEGTVYRFIWDKTTSSHNVRSLTEAKLEIYPNPASDFLIIKTLEENVDVSIEIFGLDGMRQQITHDFQENLVDISSLSPGFYLLVYRMGAVNVESVLFYKK
jgi:hypothetical protein